jgi:Protein of unknown function (DUF1552)
MATDSGRFSRRRFLGSAGVTVTLPMLPSLLWSRRSGAATCAPIKRFMAYHFPNGHHMIEHVPVGTGSGANWKLPPTLATMQDLKADLTFIGGLENQQRRRSTGDHALGLASLLTARFPTANQTKMSMSVDQIIGDAQQGCRGLHSFQLGTHNSGPTDTFGTFYTRNISWRAPATKNADGSLSFPVGAATPLGKEIDAQKAFDRLFMGTSPTTSAAEAALRRSLRKSVLDSVVAQQASLKNRLNPADQAKVDQLFTGIRSLEQELQSAPLAGSCVPPGPVPGKPANPTDKNGLTGTDFLQQVDFMHSLMAIAFQCDVTRVITFMLSDAVTSRNYNFVPEVKALGAASGGATSDHQVSHHGSNAALTAVFRQIFYYKMSIIGGFLRKLKGLIDADGNDLLHNSLIMIASEIADGDRHNHDDLPILLAGRLGGLVTPDRHVRYPVSKDYTTMKTYGDFYITLLKLYGVSTSAFGDDGKEALAWNA